VTSGMHAILYFQSVYSMKMSIEVFQFVHTRLVPVWCTYSYHIRSAFWYMPWCYFFGPRLVIYTLSRSSRSWKSV